MGSKISAISARWSMWAGCVLCLSASAIAAPLNPQWIPNGQPVQPSPSAVSKAVPIADETGGVFIVWLDKAVGEAAQHVRIGHLLSSGQRDPRWPADGLRLGGFSGDWFAESDRSGGAYVLVAVAGTRRMTRVRVDGTLDPNWSAGGGREVPPVVEGGYAVDRSGGIWAAAVGSSTTCYPGFPNHCFSSWWLGVTRLAPDGVEVAGWERPGRHFPALMGESGSILRFFGTRAVGDGVRFAMRYHAWSSVYQSFHHLLYGISSDGEGRNVIDHLDGDDFEGGAFAGDDSGREFMALGGYYSRITLDRWNADTLWNPRFQLNHPDASVPLATIADGTGGAFVGFSLEHYEPSPVYVPPTRTDWIIRVTPGGASDSRWPSNGRSLDVAVVGGVQERRLIADGRGGCFVTWHDSRVSEDADVYAQRFAQDGSLPDGWLDSGFPIARVAGSTQSSPYACADRLGNVFVAWCDGRNGGKNAYVQRLSNAAPVAAQVQHAQASWVDDRVEVIWALANPPAVDLVAERGSEEAGWTALGSLESGSARDEWRIVDPSPPTSSVITYRLHETRSGWTGGEVSIASASARLAIAGPYPHPLTRMSRFDLESSGDSAIQLEVVDLQGRSVATRQVGGRTRSVTWPEISALRPGLYWLRASQGTRATTTRFVVTR